MKAWENAEISELNVNETAEIVYTKDEAGRTWGNSGYGYFLVAGVNS